MIKLAQVLLITLFLASGPALADSVPEGIGWDGAFVTLVDVNFGNTGFHARYEYFHCECGDILVRMEQTAPDGVMTGEVLLIEGQVLAGRGQIALAPDLEPMLQAPSLMISLAINLLQYTIPGGPAEVTNKHLISTREMQVDFELDSGIATGNFKAPWEVRGSVRPSSDGQRRFDLEFKFANPLPQDPDRADSISFTGGQDYSRDDFPVRDDMVLDGWFIQWISKGELRTSPAPEGITVSDLREEAIALANPQT